MSESTTDVSRGVFWCEGGPETSHVVIFCLLCKIFWRTFVPVDSDEPDVYKVPSPSDSTYKRGALEVTASRRVSPSSRTSTGLPWGQRRTTRNPVDCGTTRTSDNVSPSCYFSPHRPSSTPYPSPGKTPRGYGGNLGRQV